MSNSDIKPIQINPALFMIKSKNVKNKTVKNLKSVAHIKPNKLKTELITKIKNYKQNKHHNENHENHSLEQHSLEQTNLVSNIKKPDNLDTNNSSSKNTYNSSSLADDDDFSQSINFLKELSLKTKKKIIKKDENNFPVSLGNSDQNKNLSNNPHYSCLKNGNLPTYREWKNKTLKKSLDESSNNFSDEPSNNFSDESSNNFSDEPSNNFSDENIKLPEIFSNSEKKQSSIIPKKTTTLKYYLGKRGKKVSVLIKNSETRKKIHIEHNLLKQTNISDMKNYLKRHNLLKSGSYAPHEIIKKLYEQSLLGGDIRNSNKNNIIHNYLAE